MLTSRLTCSALLLTAATGALAQPEQQSINSQLAQALSEYDQAHALPHEKSATARILYRSAAQRFESIAASGISNGYLEFNMGNCYLQAGDVGKAILHYRRAERLVPGDPYLADNLREARARCLARIEDNRRRSVMRGLFFWHYGSSFKGRATVAITLSALFWGLLAARAKWQRPAIAWLTVVIGAATVAVAASLATTKWCEKHTPAGVVTGMDVAAYKGPGTNYPRQFAQPLQPGVEFTLQEARAHGWWQIGLADGNSGWIPSDEAALVTSLNTG